MIIVLPCLFKCAYLNARPCVGFVCSRISEFPDLRREFGAQTKKALVHEANYKFSLIKCDNYDSASWYKTPFWLHHPFLFHALSSCHLLFPSLSVLPFFANTQTAISFFFSSQIRFISFPPLSFLHSTFKSKGINGNF